MTPTRVNRMFRTGTAALCALALTALAPGFGAYAAAGGIVAQTAAAGRTIGAPIVVNTGGVFKVPTAAEFAPILGTGVSFRATQTAPLFRQPSGQVSFALPSSPLLSQTQARVPLIAAPAPFEQVARPVDAPAFANLAAASDGVDAKTGAPVNAKGQLTLGAADLSAAGVSARAGVLDRFFTGVKSYFGLDESAPSKTDSAAPVAVSANSGFVASVPAAPALALTRPSESSAPVARATPPSPIRLEGQGLRPGEKFLAAAADAPQTGKAPSQAAPVPADAPKGDDWIDSKAVKWMMIQGAISIVGFIATSVAYPLVAISALQAAALAGGIAAGAAGAYAASKFSALMALGPNASIATGPLNGIIADRLSVRNGLFLLAILRGSLALSLPLLGWFGVLNFWTLLLASIANGWQLSLLMTSEGAYYRKLAGRNHTERINTIAALRYLGLQVFLGLIVGIGAVIDHWNPMTPFVVSALLHFFVVAPIIWFKLPNNAPAAKAKAIAAAKSAGERAEAAIGKMKAFVRKFWKEILFFSGAVALYQFGLPFAVGSLIAAGFGHGSTLGIAGALAFWVVRTDGFKAVWAQKNLRAVMLISAVTFGLIYPFQYLGLPLMAQVLGGAAGKGLIYGQLLGALFFGQLLANASSAQIKNLGSVKIKYTNLSVPWNRVVQGTALLLAAVWTGLRLFPATLPAFAITLAAAGVLAWAATRIVRPGSRLAGFGAAAAALAPLFMWGHLPSAAAMLGGAVLMWGASKFTSRGWVKFLGVGLTAATLVPLFFWGNIPAIFGAVLALGLFVGPAGVALNSYFGRNANAANIGNAYGASSSLNNAATSFGYGLIGYLISLYHPAFPGALGPISLAFMAIGAFFLMLAPRLLPDLPEKSFLSAAKPAAPADKK